MAHASELLMFILAIAICLLVVLRIVRSRRIAREKRAAEERERVEKTMAKLNELIPEVQRLCDEISRLYNFDSGYLIKKDWDALLASAEPTIAAISAIPKEIVESSEHSQTVAYLLERCQDTAFRENRNREYKDHELKACDSLLSDIDGGKSLDPQQRDATITDEYSRYLWNSRRRIVAPTSPTSTLPTTTSGLSTSALTRMGAFLG